MTGAAVDLAMVGGRVAATAAWRTAPACSPSPMRSWRRRRRLERERRALRAVLDAAAFVDTCAVVAFFNIVDRIADATGIPLDESMLPMSDAVRAELDLADSPRPPTRRRSECPASLLPAGAFSGKREAQLTRG